MNRTWTLKELAPVQHQRLAALSTRAGERAAQSLALLMGLPVGALRAQPFAVGGPVEVQQALGKEYAVAVMFKLAGGVNGRFWLLAPLPDMLALAARLLGQVQPLTALDENARGALAEAGNVVSSSFINVFGDTLHQVCYPSVPEVRHAPAGVLGRLALDATDCVGLVAVQGAPWNGTLLWSPDPLSLRALMNALEA